MIGHIFLPGMRLRPIPLLPEHESYLKDWHAVALASADADDICASMCLQAVFIELTLFGSIKTDWLGHFDACLSGPDKIPLAYSQKYGERLYRFGKQVMQATVISIHTRWWLELLHDPSAVDHDRYGHLLLTQKLRDGLIYDHDISTTVLHHRMKTELTMSLAYALEILQFAGLLNASLRDELTLSLVDPRKCPPGRYMSTEYFRLRALELLDAINYFPACIEEAIEACATGLSIGFGDFAMADKRDAYMGTAKRTRRDRPIHSPLSACHVQALTAMITQANAKNRIETRLGAYRQHLQTSPMDAPAFQMRDVHIPFGAGTTPIEILCAAHLIADEVCR